MTPIKKFKLYPVEVAIWRFVDDDTGRVSFSTKVEKNIKDKETGDYKVKPFLYPDEVSVAATLLIMAAGWIAQQDKKLPRDLITEAQAETEEKEKPF